MSLVGRELGGRYRLVSILGAGGMATVYRAEDLRLERPVAVKVLSADLAADETLTKRFDQEARALAALSHPAIVSVFDVGEEEGAPWLVMELVDGETLADRIERSSGIDPSEALPILTSVVQGLGALHAAGFVHRDVKPQNVLLSAVGGARLADFGLVRGRKSRDLTAPGTTLGTLAYLAPEILAGEPATPTSDVYALAAVSYEVLTGRPPYPTDTVAGLVHAQAAPPPSPSSIAPHLGSHFDDPLLRALGPAADRPDLGSFGASLGRAHRAWMASGPHPNRGTSAPAGMVDTGAMTRSIGIARSDQPAGTALSRGLPVVGGALLGLLLLAGIIAALGAIRPFEGSAAPTSPAAVIVPSPTATPSASPAVVAPIDPADALGRLVAEVGSRIDEAVGGRDGLRGSDARRLRERLDEVAARLQQDDPRGAFNAAEKLIGAIEELRDERLGGEAGDRLLAAAERLRNALASLAGREPPPGDDDDDD